MCIIRGTAVAAMTNQTAPRKTDAKYNWLHVTCTEIRLVMANVAVLLLGFSNKLPYFTPPNGELLFGKNFEKKLLIFFATWQRNHDRSLMIAEEYAKNAFSDVLPEDRSFSALHAKKVKYFCGDGRSPQKAEAQQSSPQQQPEMHFSHHFKKWSFYNCAYMADRGPVADVEG
uniref:Uncharacterized protein n=1 Tax=Romanomermis culicivorax TaxID=13658 RepID=A0A915JKW1_ROMCU